MNSGFLSLMLSIGHLTGLFDTIAGLPPSTSADIAAAAGLHEGYVREWLGAMVVGRIVEYEAGSRTYRLPPEHAASLTRAAGPDNLAELTQFVALLGNVEDAIIRGRIARLMLNEPPLHEPVDKNRAVAARVQAMLAKGELEQALVVVQTEIAKQSP